MSDTKPSAATPSPGDAAPPPRELQRDPTARGLIRWLMIVLLIWGLIAAIGVVRYDYLNDQLNFYKPVVVILCTFVVLGVWESALRRRAARRVTRADEKTEQLGKMP